MWIETGPQSGQDIKCHSELLMNNDTIENNAYAGSVKVIGEESGINDPSSNSELVFQTCLRERHEPISFPRNCELNRKIY